MAGIVRWHHAIIYTDKTSPLPGEEGLLDSIRVKGNTLNDRLDPRSRINFGKMYTIDHNCKVYDFGDVHRDYLSILTANWRFVLKRDIAGREEQTEGVESTQTQGGSQCHSDDKDNEDDDYEDDEDYEDEYGE
jgi:hypothetical protein